MQLFCKLCKKITKHLDLGVDVHPNVRFKCMFCGEYNRGE